MESSFTCFSCMHPLHSREEVCPACGYDNHIRSNGPGLLPETILNGQYLVGRVLGRGGFGITYIGYDCKLERVVAIKEFFPSHLVNRDSYTHVLSVIPDSRQDFQKGCQKALRESKMAARLGQIPGIVQVYNVFSENNTIYIVMEFIDGVTLTQYVKNAPGRISLQDAISLLTPVAEALCRLHEMEVIHRDVKPDNIMIRSGSHTSVLLDFGAARDRDGSTLSHSAAVVSTGYTPVEQYNSYGMDGRIDEYAFCSTLYFTLLGVAPPESILRLVEKSSLSLCNYNPTVSAQAETVILKGMSVMAASRYPSMQEMWNALLATQKKQSSFSAKKVAAVAVSAAIIAGSAGYLLLRENEAVPLFTTSPLPTSTPTAVSTVTSTLVPTPTPTTIPTATPTVVLTATPTVAPTPTPTVIPTTTPTVVPTATPTAVPTPTPTVVPTATPTAVPTTTPTTVPTPTPTVIPTVTPTSVPTPTPTVAPTAKPTVVPTANPFAVIHPEIQIGTHITFGHWEQDNDLANGPDPVEWLVLDRQDQRVLVMTKDIIVGPTADNYKHIHGHDYDYWAHGGFDSYGNALGASWEKSVARKGLNTTFLSGLVKPELRSAILTVDVAAEALPEAVSSSAGGSTRDQIFALSYSEVEKYLPDPASRTASLSETLLNNPPYNRPPSGGWCLRHPVKVYKNKINAAYISDSGIYENGWTCDLYRPACWIDLSKAQDAVALAVEETLVPGWEAGTKFTLGRYEQDNDSATTSEPIGWTVIHREGNRVLALSDHVLTAMKYHQDSKTTWEKSSIRQWLNGVFLDDAFSPDEKSVLAQRAVPPEQTSQGKYTTDYVFVLSRTELEAFLPNPSDRLASPTPYAIFQKAGYVNNDGYCWWWLRDSPKGTKFSSTVNNEGHFDSRSVNFATRIGVRPAIWVNLDSENFSSVVHPAE